MTTLLDPRAEAAAAQRAAADPTRHAFVSANAGSGKTKVLVDRVISLLLAGAAPDRIVCLTYTKAAASEMRARLFRRLGDWAVADDDTLVTALEAAGLGDGLIPVDAAGFARVRGLFAQALETPGGLKIQTIHAFCERVLRRFPLEAGLNPGFEVLDDAAAAVLTAKAAGRAAAAADGADPALSSAHAKLAAEVSEEAARGLLAWVRERATTLQSVFDAAGGLEPLAERVRHRLGVAADDTSDGVKAAAWAATPHGRLRDAAAVLAQGAVTDQRRAAALGDALDAGAPAAAFDAYCAALFTEKGDGPPPKAGPVTKKTAAASPAIATFLASEVERLDAARERARAAAVAELSVAGLTVAHRFLSAYVALKRRAGVVDFADLIAHARMLVRSSDALDWVLYKLDGGVDHVLLDEAQDTAPEQWALIEALTTEFIAGAGAAEGRALAPTVFAVGDEKQSIYSFQGAAPEKFLEAGQRVADREPERYVGPQMRVSFRSAPAILETVDAVFSAEPSLAAALSPRGDLPAHRADRDDIPGRVTLWPLVDPPDAPAPPDIWAPVDAMRRDHQDDILARRIAGHVAQLLEDGASVSVRDGVSRRARAMRPRDVMILLRRRSGLFARILQRLKGAGVPVAGADRLVLAEHVAVEDLLGVARIALAPTDDLALAEFLKSPFVHPEGRAEPTIDDAALFDLAHNRAGALWDALHARDDARFAEARALTSDLRVRAQHETPFAFLAGFLDRASATGESYARRLIARLGPDAHDPVREVLAMAAGWAAAPAPSLEGFVHALAQTAAPVKRDGDGERDEVRVMTVHGAKGLEAPLVILPDAADGPGRGGADGGLMSDADAGLMWSPRKVADPSVVAALREEDADAARREDLRLLYVAMTRAEDQLTVCGAGGRGRGGPLSWHGRVEAGLRALAASACVTPVGGGLAWGETPQRAAIATRREDPAAAVVAPAWAQSPVRRDAPANAPLSPSRLVADDHPVASPVSGAADRAAARFQRGRLVHRLMELLPDVAPEDRRRRGEQLLAAEGTPQDAAAAMLEEVMRVLDDPAFSAVFAPGSQAEVAIAGVAGAVSDGRVVSGRIDRLAVTPDAVLIVDFKSDRPPPDDALDVGGPYRAQLAAYRDVLRALYPRRAVRCALLWTFTPKLMEIPQALLDDAPQLA